MLSLAQNQIDVFRTTLPSYEYRLPLDCRGSLHRRRRTTHRLVTATIRSTPHFHLREGLLTITLRSNKRPLSVLQLSCIALGLFSVAEDSDDIAVREYAAGRFGVLKGDEDSVVILWL